MDFEIVPVVILSDFSVQYPLKQVWLSEMTPPESSIEAPRLHKYCPEDGQIRYSVLTHNE
jgi:hypothetical protein